MLLAGVVATLLVGVTVRHINSVRIENGLQPFNAENGWSGFKSILAHTRDQAARHDHKPLFTIIAEAYQNAGPGVKRAGRALKIGLLGFIVFVTIAGVVSAFLSSRLFLTMVSKPAIILSIPNTERVQLSPFVTRLGSEWPGSFDELYTTGRVPRTGVCGMARKVSINDTGYWEVAVPMVTYYQADDAPLLVTDEASYEALDNDMRRRVSSFGRNADFIILPEGSIQVVNDISECPNSWPLENIRPMFN